MSTMSENAGGVAERPETPPGLQEFHSGNFGQALLHGLRGAELRAKAARSFDASPIAIMVTDRNGVIEYVNDQFGALTGFTFDEVLGATPRILKSPETPAEHFRHVWKSLSEGREWHGEFRNRKKTGESYWEFSSIWPLRNNAGTVKHFLAVKSDITRRKAKAAEEQKAFVELQRMMVHSQLLAGRICVCAWCKKVREEQNWTEISLFLSSRSPVQITHGICPECFTVELAKTSRPLPHPLGMETTPLVTGHGSIPSHWGINE